MNGPVSWQHLTPQWQWWSKFGGGLLADATEIAHPHIQSDPGDAVFGWVGIMRHEAK
jgi:hypothetical protein